ncbi:glycosyltransferase [Ralstonia solanacearum]|uniref:UDP-glucuronosyltransferase n=2 Tax=Ralstonia solanacearum TaxID=305 RepID=A0A5H2PT58_RALSL|nr:nucleotide disphospho-sugar-binding domain-containing protein [Ralstonia solanacearum]AEG70944.1 putative UDP-glucuronosyltransferase-like protein [Ralstonia solanacearum Po82]AMP72201.1 UDP-glucuronosyltransferase [Ralstonia solanacearum]AMP76802.1 UDP-glucuronosyltransferase [Ralstonia solanacearum]AYB62412.1 UDP-glucuronosyltransferase [Ralstonia solanacearum]EUJ13147.1 UDP-glucuronosyltransferase [Ralstonia solanacearum P673]
MSRILFAWELGANLGHLARDLPVARRLREQGHDVAFAVKDVRVAEQILSPARLPFVQAPVFMPGAPSRQAPASYSEILIGAGYGDVAGLSARVHAWTALFAMHGTQTLVVNHAPTALLAARAMGLPAVLTCIGFELPPAVSPLPNFRAWESIAPERLRQADAVVLDSLNTILAGHGREPMRRVADLFSGVAAVLTTFPELDHYGARTDAVYVGPLSSVSEATAFPWPQAPGKRVFAYLRPSMPGFEPLLSVLAELDAWTLCVAPGMPQDMIRRFASPRLHILTRPVALDTTLKGADLAVVYGTGTMTDALMAGVPQVMTPQVVEQLLVAQRIAAIGGGMLWSPPRSRESAAALLRAALCDTSLKPHAERFAARYREYSPKRALTAITDMINAAGASRATPAA